MSKWWWTSRSRIRAAAAHGTSGRCCRRDLDLGAEDHALHRSTGVGLARLEHQAQLESAKAHAVGYVGQHAMVSQMEAQMGQACPMTVSRLQRISDMTALSIA